MALTTDINDPNRARYGRIETFTTSEIDTGKKLAPDGQNGVEWVGGGDESTFIDFTTGLPNPSYLEGRVFYDDEKKALSYYNDEADTTINLAQETIIKVRNDSGVLIANGDAVRVAGSLGGLPCVVKAQADTVNNAVVSGVATHSISNGTTGYVTTIGSVGDINTLPFLAGDLLYLSESVAGGLTNVEQPILNPIAVVTNVDALGSIFVNPRGIINPTAIGQVIGLGKVQVLNTTPTSILAYNNTSNFTVNTTINQTGSDPYTAQIFPATTGASGFYRVTLTISIVGTGNQIHNFELYINGVASGILGVVDLVNNNINTGSTTLGIITPAVVSPTDEIEIYGYVDSGTSTTTYETAVFNIERLGTN